MEAWVVCGTELLPSSVVEETEELSPVLTEVEVVQLVDEVALWEVELGKELVSISEVGTSDVGTAEVVGCS